MSAFDDGLAIGLSLGVAVGILVDRVVIPWCERIGERLALIRLRRGRDGR